MSDTPHGLTVNLEVNLPMDTTQTLDNTTEYDGSGSHSRQPTLTGDVDCGWGIGECPRMLSERALLNQ